MRVVIYHENLQTKRCKILIEKFQKNTKINENDQKMRTKFRNEYCSQIFVNTMHINIDLTFHKTIKIVIFEFNHKFTNEIQCLNRIHRIEQTKKIIVYKFHCDEKQKIDSKKNVRTMINIRFMFVNDKKI